ncbi:filamentous hemagglutinin N-terminal domain-containing protein [Selenomonas timonae]|uniref:Filamentous hemagglutinin N-terminal domain-containing protein n=1 Tax=Selenomonas timonae TaxID=2754044 RepID=A0A7G7VM97_9FIRM|nr:filamentous hemagglutinin N-terminal domain-containing protein [Selenomonas timonae]QNH55240.1 filamentous hemagglutinin N-terminal domain-containing protein [Selenomonas timonae]
MNKRWKNLRRSTLTALITLALSSSAFAMPTGGVIEQGNVGVDIGNLAVVGDGATITTQTNSIINWQDFSIGAGQSLNFNTAAGALLNRVTSDKVSELLGTMTQTGVNPLFVVNPNGIHVGGSANIDAANLTLSTLEMSSGDFLNAARKSNYNLVQGSKGVKEVTVDNGARLGVGNTMNIYGSKVVVADGVIFNQSDKKTADKSYALILAGDRATMWMDSKDGETQPVRVTTTKDNTVDFHGNMNIYGNTDARVIGSTVNLDRANVSVGAKFEAMAVKQASYNGNVFYESADQSNVLSANNFTGNSGQYALSGGKVDLKNSAIHGSKIEIRGEKDYQTTGDLQRGNAIQEQRADTDNTVSLDNVTLTQNGYRGDEYAWFYINGGKTEIKNGSTIETTQTGNISAAQYVKRTQVKSGENKTTEFDWQTTKDNALTVSGGRLAGHTGQKDDSLTLIGSTVDLNNGVKIEAAGQFNAGAVQRMYGRSDRNDIATVKGNALRTDGADIKANSMYMAGGNVQLKDTVANVTEDSDIAAIKTWTVVGERNNKTADVDNVLHLDNTKVTLDGDLVIGGGTVNLVNGTTIKGDELTFGAGHSHDGTTTRVTADNKVNLWNSKIEGRDVELHAGGAGIWNSSTIDATEKLNADNPVVRTDGSNLSLLRDEASHVRLNGIEAADVKVVTTVPAVPTTPKIPDAAVMPMPAPSDAGSASDAENMATGMNKARAVLNASKNSVERRENMAIQMRELSQNSPSGRASIGVVMGAIQAISDSGLAEEEQRALMQIVINADDTTNRVTTEQDRATVVTTADAVEVAEYADVTNPFDMSEAAEGITFSDQG